LQGPAIPALIEVLKKSENPRVIERVAYTLGFLGKKSKEAVPTLIKKLKHTNKDIRIFLIRTLVKIGWGTKPVIQVLLNIKEKDKNKEVKKAALEALKIPHLIETIENMENKKEVERAVKVIEMIGEPIIPYLFESLNKEESGGGLPEKLLIKIAKKKGKSFLIPYFVKNVTEEEPYLLVNIIRIIKRLEIKSEKLAELFVPILASENGTVPHEASNVLWAMMPISLPAIIKGIDHKNNRVRSKSIFLLGNIIHKTPLLFKKLKKAQKESLFKSLEKAQKEKDSELKEKANDVLEFLKGIE